MEGHAFDTDKSKGFEKYRASRARSRNADEDRELFGVGHFLLDLERPTSATDSWNSDLTPGGIKISVFRSFFADRRWTRTRRLLITNRGNEIPSRLCNPEMQSGIGQHGLKMDYRVVRF
ncbi:MAG: hypothetical protein ND866_28305 [Pyrinomonadaceae bacterium]|nr:hypothetical protein [Pyrinomonadaceae bacterium]